MAANRANRTYTFVVEATISMHLDVEAASLSEALKKAQSASTMGLCHQCANGSEGEWSTSGELDAEPANSNLVEVMVDGDTDEKALKTARAEWG